MTCLREADQVIYKLLDEGYDYTTKRVEIARLFEEYLYHGNWDSVTDFGDQTPDLRFIQEDEYDQHMEEDDQPEYIVYASGHYVMLA